MLSAIEADPQNFSPSALLRAVVQDYLLPTVAYVGGAAEISYFAQSEVVYGRLLGRMPVILSRPGFTLVDTKAAKLLKTYKLSVEDIWAGAQEVRRRMELVSVPKAISKDFERNHKQVMKMLDQLKKEIEKLDPTLLVRAVQTAAQKNRLPDETSCAARLGVRKTPKPGILSATKTSSNFFILTKR